MGGEIVNYCQKAVEPWHPRAGAEIVGIWDTPSVAAWEEGGFDFYVYETCEPTEIPGYYVRLQWVTVAVG